MFCWEIPVKEVFVPHLFQIVYHDDPLRFVAVRDVLHVLFQKIEQVGTAETVDLIHILRQNIKHGLPSAPFAQFHNPVEVLDSWILFIQLASEVLDVVAG